MKKTILLIDDDCAIHKQITRTLVKAGFEVTSAFTGLEGLKAFDNCHPDLVIVDFLMPGMTGLDTYHELCARHPDLSVPIVMLTGATHSDCTVEHMLKSGISAYLQKPFGNKELHNVIENVLVTNLLNLRRNQLKNAVENSKNFLENLVESCPVLILATDTLGKITYANQLACKWFCRETSEMVGEPIVQFVADAKKMIIELLENQPDLGQDSFEYEVTVPSAKKKVWLGIRYSYLTGKKNEFTGLLAVAQDLTTQKQLEGELKERARLQALTESLATINHQINNPLTPILGNIQLLRQDETTITNENKRRLKIIEINARKISQIIKKLNQLTSANSIQYYGDSMMLEL